MAVDSVTTATGGDVFDNTANPLASVQSSLDNGTPIAPDTDFFFGSQDSDSLLNLILQP